MRRDWLSVHVAAAVVAPLLLGAHSGEAQASAVLPDSPRQIAQANPLTSPGSTGSGEASESHVATTTTSTLKESGAPLGADGDSNAPSQSLDTAAPVDNATTEGEAAKPVASGDDALPSLEQSANNPYLRDNTVGLTPGRSAGDHEFGAFVPPTVAISKEISSSQAGTEMRKILGEEVYNRRVNITTPPDTEVAEVIRLLAERANLNFVYGEGVIHGKVTLNLKDVPLGVALQSLLSAQDLAIVREGDNVMRIAARKEVRPGAVDTQTIYIKLNWVNATDLAGTLKSAVGSGGQGTVQAHTESNTLIITDSAPNVALLRDLVAQLDVPEKQVMIEARLVELLIDTRRDLGRDVSINRIGRHDVEDEHNGLSTILSQTGSNSLSFGGVLSVLGSHYDIAATLNGLETQNVVNTIADPRIITLNNQEASIKIDQQIPYLEAQQGVTQGAITASVNFKQAGIELHVLPNITNNGYVRMKLTPTQEIHSGNFDSPQGPIPIIDERTALTNVIVKDEDTAVLGGLRQVSASDNKDAYPWLGKTPILGWLFKNDSKFHTKNDLMLFVTPHIVKAPVLTPAENYKYTRIDAHWDLPDYFFDDSVDQRESRHRFEADQNPRNYYAQNLLLPAPEGANSAAADAEGDGSGIK